MRLRLKPPHWSALLLLGLVLLLGGTWYWTEAALPAQIRIAAGQPGGLYYRTATLLAEGLRERTGRPVTVLESAGPLANLEMLRNGSAEMGILQAGVVRPGNIAVLAPLFHEVIHIIARRGVGIDRLTDLSGRKVSLGPVGSGMRASAFLLLEHYGVTADVIQQQDLYFNHLMDVDSDLDAAVVTAGMLNPDLRRVLASGHFKLLPLDAAQAIALRYPALTPMDIPRELYAATPSVPPQPLPSLADTAYLMMGDSGSKRLIRESLEVLFGGNLRSEIPVLFTARQAQAQEGLNLSPDARAYFTPYAGLDALSGFVQFLAAFKELLFALGAGVYLLWDQLRRRERRRRERIIKRHKERLDRYFEATTRIERAQMEETDPIRLREYLDEVTLVKLRALDAFTQEELRNDRQFVIFLQQCSTLSSKLEWKISQAHQQDNCL